MPNPDPLHVVRDDERLLIRVGGELLDERAYRIGLVDGAASHPLWGRIIAVIVGAFIAGLLIGRLIVPVSAAPRSGQTTERFDLSPPSSAALSGAPRSGTAVEAAAEATRVAPTPVGGVGAPPSPAADVGTAIASGIVAYAAPALGDRYLALPGGPGALVRICARSGTVCLDRVSTDAGPALSMQRAGRIADVSFVDFAWLCRCDPPNVGLLVATIEWIRPELTPPATETEP